VEEGEPELELPEEEEVVSFSELLAIGLLLLPSHSSNAESYLPAFSDCGTS
jgi:hypothetical protein